MNTTKNTLEDIMGKLDLLEKKVTTVATQRNQLFNFVVNVALYAEEPFRTTARDLLSRLGLTEESK